MKGKIYLIPTTLGEVDLNDVLPRKLFDILNNIKFFIVENVRTSRRFLIKADINNKIDDLSFYVIDKHSNKDQYHSFLNPALEGHNIGVISEAGAPGVADPGAEIVNLAHQKNLQVVPLVGPSSILLALMASGLNGQNFCFVGYLPVKKPMRIKRLKELEYASRKANQTQIFIEAPYRNQQLLDDIINTCNNNTLFCIACDITLNTEFIKTQSISSWKMRKPQINKRPAIFLLLAN